MFSKLTPSPEWRHMTQQADYTHVRSFCQYSNVLGQSGHQMVIVRMMSVFSGQLFDGFDEEYQCPVLDEDRVSNGWMRVWGLTTLCSELQC